MEFGSANGSQCLSYDVDQARLVLVQDGERHEISIRAQAHRLVRYMVERNEASGGPALCTHDELMEAVWAGEPMHTREELAKLVWEVRKKLEPFGAGQLIENERRRGYRLRTCPAPAAPPGAPAATPHPRRAPLTGRAVVLGIVVVLGALVAAIVIATRDHSSGKPDGGTATLRTFVDRVENVLQQAQSGRREIGATLTAAFNCSISPHEAGQRIASVADNRQSILGQLGIFATPTQPADAAVTFLQQALQQSIEADRHYRDAFFETAQSGTGCPPHQNASFRLAARSSARATSAKRHFVTAFNPLASRVGRPTWTPADF